MARNLGKMLRILKYFSLTVCTLMGLLLLLAVSSYYFPPRYEAVAKLPNSPSKIVLQLEPMHPWLAEYKRFAVIRRLGEPDERIEMFPDTGGYSRTQLYSLPDGIFLLNGFFDSVKIYPAKRKLISGPEGEISGTYLGAFDRTHDGNWQFIEAVKSPEQSLVAGGGE
jgi:hypothetical protein